MYRKKLKKLHNFVSKHVEDDWLNMNHWFSNPTDFKAKKCGTTACLFGWAVVAFPISIRWATKRDKGVVSPIVMRKHPRKHVLTMDIAQDFFGLTKLQTYFLFEPAYYPRTEVITREQALERLKWFYEEAPDDFEISEEDAQKRLIPWKKKHVPV